MSDVFVSLIVFMVIISILTFFNSFIFFIFLKTWKRNFEKENDELKEHIDLLKHVIRIYERVIYNDAKNNEEKD